MLPSPTPSPHFQPSRNTAPFPGPQSSQWNPLVIALVGVICTVFLFFSCQKIQQHGCTFHAISFSRNRGQRRRLNEDNPDDPSLQFQSQGVDSYIMRSLPIIQFKKEGESGQSKGQSNMECAVCLAEFEEGEGLKHLPNCSHIFHISCIDAWLQAHSSCPLCRSHVFNLEYAISVYTLQETLISEDLHQERSEFHQVLRSHILHSSPILDQENAN